MKFHQLTVLCFLLFSTIAQAQLRVQPREFTDPIANYSVTKVRCVVGDIEFGFQPIHPTLYFEFIDSTGRVRASRRVTVGELAVDLRPIVRQQQPELTDAEAEIVAAEQVRMMIHGLLAPSNADRFVAASTLAAAYGYTPLPLEEQSP